jgi:hypothetical protein
MLNYYVDLSIASGGSGTELDPWGLADWRSSVGSNPTTDSRTYYLKNSCTITDADLDIASNHATHTTTITAWDKTAPPKIVLNRTAAVSYVIVVGGVAVTTFSNLMFQNEKSQVFNSYDIGNCAFENCLFIVNIDDYLVVYIGVTSASYTVTFKGCGFITSASVTPAPAYIKPRSSSSGTINMTIDSCYFEGNASYIFNGEVGKGGIDVNVVYRRSAVYDNDDYTGEWTGTIDSYSGGVGNNNLFNDALASALADTSDYDILQYTQADLTPKAAAAIIDAGNPSLGLVYDLYGNTRSYDPNPNIGAVYSPASPTGRVIDSKIGITQIAKGMISANRSPKQIYFAEGMGSGNLGDDITIAMDGTAEVFVGYSEYTEEGLVLRNQISHQVFSGSETKTIPIASDRSALMNWMDVYVGT